MDRFEAEYGATYPKAVASLRRDQDKLLTFYDFPAEHSKHIRTSSPVECVLHRTPAPTDHQGAGISKARLDDGVQAPADG